MQNRYTTHKRGKVTFYELSSDMVFSNVVAVQFQAGAISDAPDKQGLAHLTEHILTHESKTTSSYLKDELDGLYQFAYTNKETTTYLFKSSSFPVVDLTKRAISQLTQHITDLSLKEEKSVIKAEIQGSKKESADRVYNKAIERHVESIGIEYTQYQHDVRGKYNTLSNITVEDVNSLLKDNYIQPKIVIATNKPLTPEECELIFQLLKKFIWLQQPKKKVSNNKVKSSLKRTSVDSTEIICLSVMRPQTSYYDVYLGLLLDYLAGNWSSVLNQYLRVRTPLIYFASGSYHSFKDHALVYLYFDYEKKNLSAIKKIISQVLQQLFIAKEVDSDILNAAKKIRAHKLRNLCKDEQEWVLDYFDMTKLAHNSKHKKDYTLEDYIADTIQVSTHDFKQFLTHLDTEVDLH